jgi:hypothetical protein
VHYLHLDIVRCTCAFASAEHGYDVIVTILPYTLYIRKGTVPIA